MNLIMNKQNSDFPIPYWFRRSPSFRRLSTFPNSISYVVVVSGFIDFGDSVVGLGIFASFIVDTGTTLKSMKNRELGIYL